MKILEIEGNHPLSGTIRIGGAKNSAVALIPACILTSNKVTLTNVPDISDINDLSNIMEYLNVDIKRASESIIIDAHNMENKLIPNESLMTTMKKFNLIDIENILEKAKFDNGEFNTPINEKIKSKR